MPDHKAVDHKKEEEHPRTMPPHPDRKPVDPLARRKAPLAAKVAPAMWGGRSCAHDSSHRFTLDGVSLAAARGFVEDAIATMMAEQPPQVITLDQRLRVFTLEVQPGTADHVIIWLWTPLGCAARCPRARSRLASVPARDWARARAVLRVHWLLGIRRVPAPTRADPHPAAAHARVPLCGRQLV